MSDALKKIIAFETNLAAGVGSVKINVHEDSATAALSLFLRSFRGRSDCADAIAILQPGFQNRLEVLRTHISDGRLSEAQVLLSQLNPATELEQGEALLERVRLNTKLGRFDQALTDSTSALALKGLPDTTRMTIHQVRGDILIAREDFTRAVEELKISIRYGEILALASSALSARAFLVVAYCKMHEFEKALNALNALRSEVDSIANVELWIDRHLLTLRAQAHYERGNGSVETLVSVLTEASEISRWLGDSTTLNKCLIELREIEGSTIEPKTFTFQGWSYLGDSGTIINYEARSISRLHKRPLQKRLLETIIKQELIAYSDLFERVWNLPYRSERYETHMRSTLSKLRKLLPKGSLVVDSGNIQLFPARHK